MTEREARSQNETRAMAKLTVEFLIDASSLRDAEKQLDNWLRNAEDDDNLVEYRVDWTQTDWTAV